MNKLEFSKIVVAVILVIMFPAVFYLSWEVLQIARLAIAEKFTGGLPYLVAIITPAWAAVATIIGFYFNKAKEENKIKIQSSVRD